MQNKHDSASYLLLFFTSCALAPSILLERKRFHKATEGTSAGKIEETPGSKMLSTRRAAPTSRSFARIFAMTSITVVRADCS
jgi:hypothetical protein